MKSFLRIIPLILLNMLLMVATAKAGLPKVEFERWGCKITLVFPVKDENLPGWNGDCDDDGFAEGESDLRFFNKNDKYSNDAVDIYKIHGSVRKGRFVGEKFEFYDLKTGESYTYWMVDGKPIIIQYGTYPNLKGRYWLIDGYATQAYEISHDQAMSTIDMAMKMAKNKKQEAATGTAAAEAAKKEREQQEQAKAKEQTDRDAKAKQDSKNRPDKNSSVKDGQAGDNGKYENDPDVQKAKALRCESSLEWLPRIDGTQWHKQVDAKSSYEISTADLEKILTWLPSTGLSRDHSWGGLSSAIEQVNCYLARSKKIDAAVETARQRDTQGDDTKDNRAPYVSFPCVTITKTGSGVSSDHRILKNNCGANVEVIWCEEKNVLENKCKMTMDTTVNWSQSSTMAPGEEGRFVSSMDGEPNAVFRVFICDMSDDSKDCLLPKKNGTPLIIKAKPRPAQQTEQFL